VKTLDITINFFLWDARHRQNDTVKSARHVYLWRTPPPEIYQGEEEDDDDDEEEMRKLETALEAKWRRRMGKMRMKINSQFLTSIDQLVPFRRNFSSAQIGLVSAK